MKKFLFIVLLMGVFAGNLSIAAAENVYSNTEYDFTSIHKMVVCEANNSLEKGSLTDDDLYAAFTIAPQKINFQISGIRDFNGKITKANLGGIAQYADVYMIPTVVRLNSTFVFFEVYDAKTQKLIYSERIKGVGAQSQSLYIETTKNFHKKFNDLVIGKVKPEKKVDKAA